MWLEEITNDELDASLGHLLASGGKNGLPKRSAGKYSEDGVKKIDVPRRLTAAASNAGDSKQRFNTVKHLHFPIETAPSATVSANMRDPTTSTVLYKILTPQEKADMPNTNWAGTALDVRFPLIHRLSLESL